jgi:hypothetical protein
MILTEVEISFLIGKACWEILKIIRAIQKQQSTWPHASSTPTTNITLSRTTPSLWMTSNVLCVGKLSFLGSTEGRTIHVDKISGRGSSGSGGGVGGGRIGGGYGEYGG